MREVPYVEKDHERGWKKEREILVQVPDMAGRGEAHCFFRLSGAFNNIECDERICRIDFRCFSMSQQ
jgi:hypothetical protein